MLVIPELDSRFLHTWLADPDLKARRRWSQRQLYAGIRYVCIASILMKLLFTLQGVLRRQKG